MLSISIFCGLTNITALLVGTDGMRWEILCIIFNSKHDQQMVTNWNARQSFFFLFLCIWEHIGFGHLEVATSWNCFVFEVVWTWLYIQWHISLEIPDLLSLPTLFLFLLDLCWHCLCLGCSCFSSNKWIKLSWRTAMNTSDVSLPIGHGPEKWWPMLCNVHL